MVGACGERCSSCPYHGRECSGCPGCGRALRCAGCAGCGYLCPGRPGARAFLHTALGGPWFPRVAEGRAWFDVSGVPVYLPSVAARVHRQPDALRWVAVHAARAVLRADGRGLRPSVARDGVRRALGLDPATPCALHFYVPDRPLEGFWRARRELYPWIADQFELVFAPNFSVYEDAPRLEHLINIKRSAAVYAEMLEAGIPAMPDVGWYEVRDLDRWAAWLNEIGPPLAAFSFQGVGPGARGSRAWMGYLAGLRYLGERLRPDVGIVLVGVAAPDRVRAARQAAGRRRIAILNSAAWSLSRKGRFADDSAAGREIHRDAVFWRNVDVLSSAYLQEEGGLQIEGLREQSTADLQGVRPAGRVLVRG